EAHLFLGLVRFQETADGLFFAPIDPAYNILKLIGHHFKSRYKGQKWVIYDTQRKYGLFYNGDSVKEISIQDPQFDLQSGKLVEEAKNMDEDQYQELWKSYYDAINISQRNNTRQMRRMMPERYWKYLPEKQKKKDRGGGRK
ncbi:MAG: TIGR03915 family putative DNA repair protein, partial [Bacteroidota bacterium]